MAKGLTHFDDSGRPRMVDISAKAATLRRASAVGAVSMNEAAFAEVKSGKGRKGDAAAVAELAGVMAAKKTADLIPLCHPLPLSSVNVVAKLDEKARRVFFHASVSTTGKTGVEMEAMMAASVACLALYDMLKAVDRAMTIEQVMLVEKSGGASGDFKRNGA